ncbi:MAG: hypothetical protein ABIP29_09385 [Candidatus Eisenbacteria bacterium]
MNSPTRGVLIVGLALGWMFPGAARGQSVDAAAWLADRGPGVRTSIFGTYARPGELLVSPFFEYYLDDNLEYSPSELVGGVDQDFRGRYRASEGLLFLAYAFNDRFALELEVAAIRARLEKSPDDPSAVPPRLEESGWGDRQAQLNWRIAHESASSPEVFSFLEVVFPSNRDKPLIGTSDWEYKLGGGVTRGWHWGTLTARASAAYAKSEPVVELGEFAVEYLKRLSPRFRLYAGIEGASDEIEAIGELQWHFSRRGYLRLNSGVGLTSKATDFAPDVGVVFALPVR